jgi:tRNA (Thr-GGU) A37 N-methylase
MDHPRGVRADLPGPSDGAPEAVLEIEERFGEALEGLRVGMELIAVTWLHEGIGDVLQVRPGRDGTRPLTACSRPALRIDRIPSASTA